MNKNRRFGAIYFFMMLFMILMMMMKNHNPSRRHSKGNNQNWTSQNYNKSATATNKLVGCNRLAADCNMNSD
jgi:hypothetical protein